MSEEREYRKCKPYKLDPETNMPIVPEGHFWRVKFTGNDWGQYSVTVQLRKRIGSLKERFDYNWFGKTYEVAANRVKLVYSGTKVWGADGYYLEEKVPPEAWASSVKQAYEGVLAKQEQYLEALEYEEKAKSAVAQLAGDYPPKRLEETE